MDKNEEKIEVINNKSVPVFVEGRVSGSAALAA